MNDRFLRNQEEAEENLYLLKWVCAPLTVLFIQFQYHQNSPQLCRTLQLITIVIWILCILWNLRPKNIEKIVEIDGRKVKKQGISHGLERQFCWGEAGATAYIEEQNKKKIKKIKKANTKQETRLLEKLDNIFDGAADRIAAQIKWIKQKIIISRIGGGAIGGVKAILWRLCFGKRRLTFFVSDDCIKKGVSFKIKRDGSPLAHAIRESRWFRWGNFDYLAVKSSKEIVVGRGLVFYLYKIDEREDSMGYSRTAAFEAGKKIPTGGYNCTVHLDRILEVQANGQLKYITV